jgi:hypothetical protein
MADAIAAFWSWWKTARSAVERAVEADDVASIDDEISARVTAMDPELRWEFGSEVEGVHGLALSWNGGLASRRITERWCAAAPASKTWRFFPARPAGDWKSLVFELGNHKIDFAGYTATFEIDTTRERADVVLFHPGAAKVSENVRGNAGLVLLDRAFGEDGVERWIGTIDLAKTRPRNARPFGDLVKAVGKLTKAATGDQWNVYSGERGGAAIVIARNEALKALDHLACDHELAVSVGFDGDERGLPSEAASDALQAIEDSLAEELGRGVAYHGRETTRNTRTMYWFASTEVKAHVAAWRKRQKRVDVTWTPDPAWERLERWT